MKGKTTKKLSMPKLTAYLEAEISIVLSTIKESVGKEYTAHQIGRYNAYQEILKLITDDE